MTGPGGSSSTSSMLLTADRAPDDGLSVRPRNSKGPVEPMLKEPRDGRVPRPASSSLTTSRRSSSKADSSDMAAVATWRYAGLVGIASLAAQSDPVDLFSSAVDDSVIDVNALLLRWERRIWGRWEREIGRGYGGRGVRRGVEK